MKGSVTGKVVDWEAGETMDKMFDKFGPWDYTVFGILLFVSSAIGVYFAWRDRRNEDEKNYALGGQAFSAWPVALSLTATSISAITIMGAPSETYVYGSTMCWGLIGDVMGCTLASFVYIPLYWSLGVTSVNEYIDLRFGKVARLVLTVISIIQALIYNGLVVYGPALAINQISGLDVNVGILLVGGICIFYTSIGGMKAVIWTDVWQIIWMVAGFVTILAVTCIDFGGFMNVVNLNISGDRYPQQYELDPRYRHTFWALAIGNSTGGTLASYVCQQYKVQRYLSCKSLKEAQKSTFLAAIGIVFISLLALMIGNCCYAYFQYCDPWKNEWISERDQVVLYLSLYLFAVLAPGVAGIYLSAVFGASLSTCSSTINSCSVIVIEDILKPYFKIKKGAVAWISKLAMLISGGLIICFAYIFRNFEGMAEACTAINSLLGGPMLGLFTTGIFFPFVFQSAGLAGLAAGLGISAWKYVGAYYNPPGQKWVRQLSLDTSLCTMNNTLVPSSDGNYFIGEEPEMSFSSAEEDSTGIYGFYHTSYCYLGTFGFSTTILVAVLISMIYNKSQTSDWWTSWADEGTTWSTKKELLFENELLSNDHLEEETEKKYSVDSSFHRMSGKVNPEKLKDQNVTNLTVCEL